jgi:fructokinase
MKILSLGEILWDVFDDAERLGGAPFNFAVNAKRLGHDVQFVSAVGDDLRGQRALAAMEEHGLPRDFVRCVQGKPTGVVEVRLDSEGHPAFTIERPAAYDFATLSEADLEAISRWSPDWVYFGTLHQLSAGGRTVTARALEACAGARRFYDVNLRKDSYTPELVSELMREATVLKLNEEELPVLAEICGAPASPIEAFCRWTGHEAVAVTLGARGCAALIGAEYVEAPGYRVKVKDTVGAGDAFAAAFLHGLGNAWPAAEVADFANRVGALVASRPGALPEWSLKEIPTP